MNHIWFFLNVSLLERIKADFDQLIDFRLWWVTGTSTPFPPFSHGSQDLRVLTIGSTNVNIVLCSKCYLSRQLTLYDVFSSIIDYLTSILDNCYKHS